MAKSANAPGSPQATSARNPLRSVLLRPATLSAPLILWWTYFVRKTYLPHGTGKVWPKIEPLFVLPWPPVLKPWWLDFIGALILAFAALCVGGWLLQRARLELGRGERILLATSTGFMALVLAASALSLVHAFKVLPLRVLVSLFLFMAILHARAEARGLLAFCRGEWAGLRREPVAYLYLALSGIFLFFGFIVAAAPEGSFDALNVHLYYPRLFLERGHFYLADLFRSTAPLYVQVLYGLGLALHGTHLAKFLNFLLLPGMLLTVFLCVRTLMADQERVVSAGLLAVLLVVSCPIVLVHSGICYPDLATAFFGFLAFYTTIRFLQTSANGWLWFAGLSAGFAMGTKYAGLYLAAILATVVLTGVVWRSGFHVGLRAAVRFGVIAMMVGSPWYLRNWYYTGDPVHPILYQYVKKPVLSQEESRWLLQDAMNTDRFPTTARNLLLLPWLVTTRGEELRGAIGPVFLWSLPLILLGWGWTAGWLAAIFSVVAFSFFWFTGPQWLRYLLPGIPMVAALATRGIYRAQNPPALRILWASIAVAFGLVNLPGLNDTWVSGGRYVVVQLPYGVTLGQQSEADYMRAVAYGFDAAQYVNRLELPPDARILHIGVGLLPFLLRYPVIDVLEKSRIVCYNERDKFVGCFSLNNDTLRANLNRHRVGLLSIHRDRPRLKDRMLFSLEHPLLRTDFKFLNYVGGDFLFERSPVGPVRGTQYVNADLLYRFAIQDEVHASDPFDIHIEDIQPTGADVRPALLMLPRNEVSYRIRLETNPQFSFFLGMSPEAAAIARGIQLSIYVRPVRGQTRQVFAKRFLPEDASKGWIPIEVYLGDFSSHECFLTLRTEPVGPGGRDWLAIADPVIYATETREPVSFTGLYVFDPASEKHPVTVRFTPDKGRSGRDKFTIEIPALANATVDLLSSVRGGSAEPAEKYCRLDAHGRARIFVPAGIPPGVIRVIGVRASGRPRWLAAQGKIEVIP